jgi:hypothetical protein
MDDAKWEKYAALGGVAFVVLNVIGAAVCGEPPAPDDSDQKIADWFNDHAGGIKASQFLGVLSAIALLWWFGSLWRKMTAAEGRHRLSIVAALGLTLSGALFLAANGILSAVAIQIEDGDTGVKIFYTLSSVLLSSSGAGVVAFLAAVNLLSLRTKMLPQWMTYLGLLSALLFLVATIGSASDSGGFKFFGFIGWLVWAIWILGVSYELWKRPTTTSAPTPSAAAAVAA